MFYNLFSFLCVRALFVLRHMHMKMIEQSNSKKEVTEITKIWVICTHRKKSAKRNRAHAISVDNFCCWVFPFIVMKLFSLSVSFHSSKANIFFNVRCSHWHEKKNLMKERECMFFYFLIFSLRSRKKGNLRLCNDSHSASTLRFSFKRLWIAFYHLLSYTFQSMHLGNKLENVK